MFSFFGFFAKPPSLRGIPLKRYRIDFSLDRLDFGVDNIHIDVHVSPQVCGAVKRTASLLMIKHSRSESYIEDYKAERCAQEISTLKRVCADVLMEGIHRAKSESEVQIDFLGQASLAKLFLEEIRNEYDALVESLETLARTYELSANRDESELFKIREKLSEIKHNQKRIVRLAGEELFQVLADVHVHSLRNIRESNFRPEHILPDHFFLNPTLHAETATDDFLLIEAYALFGQRSDDPDNYNSLRSILYDLLGRTDLERCGAGGGDPARGNQPETAGNEGDRGEADAWDPWIMEGENIDRMLNHFDTREQIRKSGEKGEPREILEGFKSRMEIQKGLFRLFDRRFSKSGLMRLVVAAYEMKSVYANYCPPLRPLQIREFLVKSQSRKPLIRQLKRREASSGSPLSLAPLQQTIRRIRTCWGSGRKRHLLSFLKDFVRYHRDLHNGRLLRNAMDAVRLVREDKTLLLSRENRSLYEFLLPDEQVREEKPILNHVIIKADIRGSMDITHTMRTRGLNPASHFSLNFFDPISEILSEYNGAKEFIEGDAIILSIFEKEETAQGWYGVARACGLAVRILQIVQQYNVKNQKHNLPLLEIGIGICYHASPPAFLFDGDSRIMISPAIHLADRLSGCDKMLRKRFRDPNRRFHLLVFQNVPEQEIEATADDLFLRYNVNGIELNREGFEKLSREISLKSVPYPGDPDENIQLFTGTVPTVNGQYQRLVIREAPILKVNPQTLEAIGATPRKYYEVCTHPDIYEFIRTQA
jgi:class 3 adenylate cyclase